MYVLLVNHVLYHQAVQFASYSLCFLIRYERVPQDFGTLGLPPVIDQSGQLTHITSANKAASSIYLTLAKYLYHRRWVWCAQHAPASNAMSMQAVGRILSTLTK